MRKFALANLFFAALLFLFGCAKTQENVEPTAQTTATEESAAPALQTVTLEVDGMT